eukprot:2917563-Pyramimonas_sp.AAC.1
MAVHDGSQESLDTACAATMAALELEVLDRHDLVGDGAARCRGRGAAIWPLRRPPSRQGADGEAGPPAGA